ncbi:MAG: hypothetical protein ABSF69_29735 [Polyangiaceae bacterium]|jgi:hypothetical protein
MAASKEDVARELVRAHFEVEPGLTRVFLIRSDDWGDPKKPIKLLEINANTLSTGSVDPYSFTPTEDTPYATMIAEISPEEFEQLEQNKLVLPRGWSLENAVPFDRPKAA